MATFREREKRMRQLEAAHAGVAAQLGPMERVAAMQRAWMRGDADAAEQLRAASPTRIYECAEHLWHGTALREIEMAWLVDQLDQVAWLHQAAHLIDDLEDTPAADRAPRLDEQRRAVAYRLVCSFDGWAQFCADLGFPAPGAIVDLPAYATVAGAIPLARTIALTPDEMRDYLAAHGAPGEPPSAATCAAQYRATLEALI